MSDLPRAFVRACLCGLLSLVTILVLAGEARAESYFLEGPGTPTRGEATQMQKAAEQEGFTGRIVRRFRHGGGWEYFLVIAGFADQTEAEAAAAQLVERVGRAFSIYASEGEVHVAEPAVEEPPVRESSSYDRAPAGDADRMVERAARRLLGERALAGEAERVLFRFRRRLPDGRVADHTYARRGSDRYLEVRLVEGAIVESRAGVAGDVGWSQVDTRVEHHDVDVSREALDRFSPDAVADLVRGIAEAVRDREELSRIVDSTVIDGEICDLVLIDGDRVRPPMTVAIERRDPRIRRVELGDPGKGIRYDLSEFHDRGGWDLPHRVQTYRAGSLVEELLIEEVGEDVVLPENWFAAPVKP